MSEFSDKIKNFTDLELINLIKNGDDNAFKELTERYKCIIKCYINKINNLGFEPDDLNQEAILGLLNAAKTYNFKIGLSFSSYAKICIKRKIYNFCKLSNRQKHIPLNRSLSISQNADENETILNKAYNPLDDDLNNPEFLLIKQEELLGIKEKMKSHLSNLEFNVLSLYSLGYSYEDISKKLRTTTKTVDNALQRAKKKLKI